MVIDGLINNFRHIFGSLVLPAVIRVMAEIILCRQIFLVSPQSLSEMNTLHTDNNAVGFLKFT